jgi:hypothetical protein
MAKQGLPLRGASALDRATIKKRDRATHLRHICTILMVCRRVLLSPGLAGGQEGETLKYYATMLQLIQEDLAVRAWEEETGG